MSKQTVFADTTAEFERIIKAIPTQEIGVGDAIEALDAADFFSRRFCQEALRRQKEVYVRTMFRKLKDDDGFPTFFHVKEATPDGQEKNYYKQLDLFTKREYEYVAADYHRRGLQQFKMCQHVLDHARARKVKLSLPFDPSDLPEA